MKHLQTYRLFESSTSLTEEQKEFLDKCTKGSWSLNPQTGKIDVKGNFNCSFEGLTDLKGIRFGKVSRDFSCGNNQLTSLKGAPETVGVDFYCNDNQLTSLEGAPQTVGRNFWCTNNQLTDLEGAPKTVRKNFVCGSNELTSLKGAPQSVGEGFHCYNNQLTSLEGAPETVGGDFLCTSNQLQTLEGSPQTVGGDFFCDEFETPNWTLDGKLEILKKGTESARTLIATVISSEVIQQRIDENPIGMSVELKGVWKFLKGMPKYEKLKFPPEYSEEAETLADLADVGL
jgi:hypothetical protein